MAQITQEFDALYRSLQTDSFGMQAMRAGQIDGTRAAEETEAKDLVDTVVEATEIGRERFEHAQYIETDEYQLSAAFAAYAARKARRAS